MTARAESAKTFDSDSPTTGATFDELRALAKSNGLTLLKRLPPGGDPQYLLRTGTAGGELVETDLGVMATRIASALAPAEDATTEVAAEETSEPAAAVTPEPNVPPETPEPGRFVSDYVAALANSDWDEILGRGDDESTPFADPPRMPEAFAGVPRGEVTHLQLRQPNPTEPKVTQSRLVQRELEVQPAATDDDPTDLSEASLPALAALANSYYEKCVASQRTALQYGWLCGTVLNEAKKREPHGGFMAWVSTNFDFSHATANAYMRLANSEHAKNLPPETSLRQALALLAEPEAEKSRPKKSKPKRKRESPPSSAPYVNKWWNRIWRIQDDVLALKLLAEKKEFQEHRDAVVRAHSENISWAKDLLTQLDAVLAGDQDVPDDMFATAEEKANKLAEKIMATVAELAECIQHNPELDSNAIKVLYGPEPPTLLVSWLRGAIPALRKRV
jgi:Protein of unknown function (DUF3102)